MREDSISGSSASKKVNRKKLECAFCGKMFEKNFSRHFIQMHPDDLAI